MGSTKRAEGSREGAAMSPACDAQRPWAEMGGGVLESCRPWLDLCQEVARAGILPSARRPEHVAVALPGRMCEVCVDPLQQHLHDVSLVSLWMRQKSCSLHQRSIKGALRSEGVMAVDIHLRDAIPLCYDAGSAASVILRPDL